MNTSRACCVPGCKESGAMTKELHHFPNPEKDKERFSKWVFNIGGDIVGHQNKFIFNNRYVCRRHFEGKQLCRANRLSKMAIPTLYMPDPLSLQKYQIKERTPLRQCLDTPKLLTLTSLQQIVDAPHPTTSTNEQRLSEHNYTKNCSDEDYVTEHLVLNMDAVSPMPIKDHDYCRLDESTPLSQPTLCELGTLPAKEEEIFSPEPMACDLDDPLGSPRNDSPMKCEDLENNRENSESPMKCENEDLENNCEDSESNVFNSLIQENKKRKIDCPEPSGNTAASVTTPVNKPPKRKMTLKEFESLKTIVRYYVPANVPRTSQHPHQNSSKPVFPQDTPESTPTQNPSGNQRTLSKPVFPQDKPASTRTQNLSKTQPPPVTAALKNTEYKPVVPKREKILIEKLKTLKKEVNQLRFRVKQIDTIASPVLKAMIDSAIRNKKKKAKGVRWTPLHKTVALNIYKKSPQTYKYFQQLVPMPSVKTLQILLCDNLLKDSSETGEGRETKPVANTAFRDITINEFDENADAAVKTISLTTPQSMEDNLDKLRRHIRHLNTVINKLQTQNKLLKDRVQSFGKNSENSLKTVTENMTPAAKVFTKMQYVQTPKKPGARKYSVEEKVLTVSMYNSSPSGYAALSNFFTLPSEQLIEKFSRQLEEGMQKSFENGQLSVVESSNINVNNSEISEEIFKRPPQKRRRGGGRGGGGDGRGGRKLPSHMRRINIHESLPPPPRLTAGAFSNPTEIVHNMNQSVEYYIPVVHSTVDVTTQERVNNTVTYYQRDLDMAIAGLTTDMPELD